MGADAWHVLARGGRWWLLNASWGCRCVAWRQEERPDLARDVLPELSRLAGAAEALAAQPLPASAARGKPPAMLLCPITQDVFEDPVIAADGHTCAHLSLVLGRPKCSATAVSPWKLSGHRLYHQAPCLMSVLHSRVVSTAGHGAFARAPARVCVGEVGGQRCVCLRRCTHTLAVHRVV